jgi:hypothetical protein
MDDKMRRLIGWVSFGMLTILAGVESALAFMSDQIAQNMEALRLTMAPGLDQSTIGTSILPTVGQMIIGFILPFALTFVAVPMESFTSASRTVLGIVAAGALRLLAFVLRLIGNTGYFIGRLIVNLYDLIIFPSIWLEGLIAGPRGRNDSGPRQMVYEEEVIKEGAPESINDTLEFNEQQEQKLT